MNAAVDLQLVLSVLILIVVLGLWWYVARHAQRVDHIERRVGLLEERVSGMPAVKTQLDALAAQVAALRERSDTSYQLMRSIQEHLMETKR